MNITDATIINALPTNTIISFVGYEDKTYTVTKQDDGRWEGRYISEHGSECYNGMQSASHVAADLAHATNITFA